MRPNAGPGKLIVFEGLDGAGTTTQSARLAEWLCCYHSVEVPRVYVTREPSPGPAGAQLRAVLTQRITMDARALAALFVADRMDHLYEAQRGIIKCLEQGVWVVMDRYYLSSFAYQALALNTDELRWLWFLHDPCLIPDVTFFLDVPVEICIQRIAHGRGFHFELFEKEEALREVRRKYMDAIRRFTDMGQNIQMVEGTASVEAVGRELQERVKKFFLEDAHLPIRD
jgi:dTMP kinase